LLSTQRLSVRAFQKGNTIFFNGAGFALCRFFCDRGKRAPGVLFFSFLQQFHTMPNTELLPRPRAALVPFGFLSQSSSHHMVTQPRVCSFRFRLGKSVVQKNKADMLPFFQSPVAFLMLWPGTTRIEKAGGKHVLCCLYAPIPLHKSLSLPRISLWALRFSNRAVCAFLLTSPAQPLPSLCAEA